MCDKLEATQSVPNDSTADGPAIGQPDGQSDGQPDGQVVAFVEGVQSEADRVGVQLVHSDTDDALYFPQSIEFNGERHVIISEAQDPETGEILLVLQGENGEHIAIQPEALSMVQSSQEGGIQVAVVSQSDQSVVSLPTTSVPMSAMTATSSVIPSIIANIPTQLTASTASTNVVQSIDTPRVTAQEEQSAILSTNQFDKQIVAPMLSIIDSSTEDNAENKKQEIKSSETMVSTNTKFINNANLSENVNIEKETDKHENVEKSDIKESENDAKSSKLDSQDIATDVSSVSKAEESGGNNSSIEAATEIGFGNTAVIQVQDSGDGASQLEALMANAMLSSDGNYVIMAATEDGQMTGLPSELNLSDMINAGSGGHQAFFIETPEGLVACTASASGEDGAIQIIPTSADINTAVMNSSQATGNLVEGQIIQAISGCQAMALTFTTNSGCIELTPVNTSTQAPILTSKSATRSRSGRSSKAKPLSPVSSMGQTILLSSESNSVKSTTTANIARGRRGGGVGGRGGRMTQESTTTTPSNASQQPLTSTTKISISQSDNLKSTALSNNLAKLDSSGQSASQSAGQGGSQLAASRRTYSKKSNIVWITPDPSQTSTPSSIDSPSKTCANTKITTSLPVTSSTTKLSSLQASTTSHSSPTKNVSLTSSLTPSALLKKEIISSSSATASNDLTVFNTSSNNSKKLSSNSTSLTTANKTGAKGNNSSVNKIIVSTPSTTTISKTVASVALINKQNITTSSGKQTTPVTAANKQITLSTPSKSSDSPTITKPITLSATNSKSSSITSNVGKSNAISTVTTSGSKVVLSTITSESKAITLGSAPVTDSSKPIASSKIADKILKTSGVESGTTIASVSKSNTSSGKLSSSKSVTTSANTSKTITTTIHVKPVSESINATTVSGKSMTTTSNTSVTSSNNKAIMSTSPSVSKSVSGSKSIGSTTASSKAHATTSSKSNTVTTPIATTSSKLISPITTTSSSVKFSTTGKTINVTTSSIVAKPTVTTTTATSGNKSIISSTTTTSGKVSATPTALAKTISTTTTTFSKPVAVTTSSKSITASMTTTSSKPITSPTTTASKTSTIATTSSPVGKVISTNKPLALSTVTTPLVTGKVNTVSAMDKDITSTSTANPGKVSTSNTSKAITSTVKTTGKNLTAVTAKSLTSVANDGKATVSASKTSTPSSNKSNVTKIATTESKVVSTPVTKITAKSLTAAKSVASKSVESLSAITDKKTVVPLSPNSSATISKSTLVSSYLTLTSDEITEYNPVTAPPLGASSSTTAKSVSSLSPQKLVSSTILAETKKVADLKIDNKEAKKLTTLLSKDEIKKLDKSEGKTTNLSIDDKINKKSSEDKLSLIVENNSDALKTSVSTVLNVEHQTLTKPEVSKGKASTEIPILAHKSISDKDVYDNGKNEANETNNSKKTVKKVSKRKHSRSPSKSKEPKKAASKSKDSKQIDIKVNDIEKGINNETEGKSDDISKSPSKITSRRTSRKKDNIIEQQINIFENQIQNSDRTTTTPVPSISTRVTRASSGKRNEVKSESISEMDVKSNETKKKIKSVSKSKSENLELKEPISEKQITDKNIETPKSVKPSETIEASATRSSARSTAKKRVQFELKETEDSAETKSEIESATNESNSNEKSETNTESNVNKNEVEAKIENVEKSENISDKSNEKTEKISKEGKSLKPSEQVINTISTRRSLRSSASGTLEKSDKVIELNKPNEVDKEMSESNVKISEAENVKTPQRMSARKRKDSQKPDIIDSETRKTKILKKSKDVIATDTVIKSDEKHLDVSVSKEVSTPTITPSRRTQRESKRKNTAQIKQKRSAKEQLRHSIASFETTLQSKKSFIQSFGFKDDSKEKQESLRRKTISSLKDLRSPTESYEYSTDECSFYVRHQSASLTSFTPKQGGGNYLCQKCGYHTTRINNLVLHHKDQCSYVKNAAIQHWQSELRKRTKPSNEVVTSSNTKSSPKKLKTDQNVDHNVEHDADNNVESSLSTSANIAFDEIDDSEEETTKVANIDKPNQDRNPTISDLDAMLLGSDDEDLLTIDNLDNPKSELGFSDDDIVWVETRNTHWPALVHKVYSKERKVSIKFIDGPWAKKSMKSNITAISSFDNAELNKKYLREGRKAIHGDLLVKAVQKAEEFLRKRCLGSDISAAKFFDQIDSDFSEHFGDEDEDKSPLIAVTDETVKSNGEKELNVNEKDSNLIESVSSAANETDEDMLSENNETVALFKEKRRISNAKLLQCIKDGKVETHLVGVYRESIQSERHQKFKTGSETEKNQLKHVPWFGPIDDEEQQEEIYDYCSQLFKSNFKTDGSFDTVAYIFEVWVPEAIVKAISRVRRLELKDSELVFAKGVILSKSEKDELTKEIQKEAEKQLITSSSE